MSRTKKFLYNSATTALYQVFMMLSGFILPRVILGCYGSEINGLVSSITQFITYFNLVEAGLSGAAIYALYKPLADNDHPAINAVVSAAKKFYFISGYIFTGLVFVLAFAYPFFVQTESLTPVSVGILVVVLGGSGFLEFFTLAKYRVLLSADQRSYMISIASIVYVVLNTAIIVVLAKLGASIVVVRAVALLAIFSRTMILAVYTRKHYKFLDFTVEPNKKALDKRWDALYMQILHAVQKGAPTVLATVFTSLKMVSIYSVFNMVLTGINNLLSIFISGLSASFGDLIARKETGKLQRAFQEFEFMYYSAVSIVYGTAMVMIMPFIRVYTDGISDANYDVPLYGFLFTLSGLLYNLKTPEGMIVISAGMYRETRLQTTIQGLLPIVVGAALAPKLGITGILLGLIASDVYRNIDLWIFVPKNITGLPVKKTLLRVLRVLISIALIVVPFHWIKLTPTNYFTWFAVAFGVLVYSAVVVLVMGLVFDRDEVKCVLKRIKSMVKKG